MRKFQHIHAFLTVHTCRGRVVQVGLFQAKDGSGLSLLVDIHFVEIIWEMESAHFETGRSRAHKTWDNLLV